MKKQFILNEPHFRVENIAIVSVSRNKKYRYSYKNGRDTHGFVYLVRGKMYDEFSSTNIEKIELSAGEMIFIPKGTSYIGNYLEDKTELRIIQFDISSGSLPDYLRYPVKINIPDARERIEAFFNDDEMGSNHSFYYLSCIYGLLWTIDKHYTRIQTKYIKLNKALSDLWENPNKNHPISHYAELCSMSEVNFRRLFREYTGKTPIEYRNDLRLDAARAKIKSGEYNVSEASESVGFTNLSFFIRLYKKKYGHTPGNE